MSSLAGAYYAHKTEPPFCPFLSILMSLDWISVHRLYGQAAYIPSTSPSKWESLLSR